MYDIEALIEVETTFFKRFTNVLYTDFGLIHYNPSNPISHDSNHALILNKDYPIMKALEEIKTFFKGYGITPRIYSTLKKGEYKRLKPFLDEAGFISDDQGTSRFFYLNQKLSVPTNPDIVIKQVKELDDAIKEMIIKVKEGDFTIKVLENHLNKSDFYFFVGYSEGKPVTCGSLCQMNGFSRVDDVMTHPDYRRIGYSRTLLNHLIGFYLNQPNQLLYLYADNPFAIKMYQQCGFQYIEEELHLWSAYYPLFRIKEVTKDHLIEYSKIPMIKKVASIYRLEPIKKGLGGITFIEEPCPYHEIDMGSDDHSLKWEQNFDIKNWGFFIAYVEDQPVGGMTLVYKTEGVHMLNGRDDLTVLWDLRIDRAYQRQGLGTELFQEAIKWAKARNCTQLKIETQNNNVNACKFYVKQGAVLGAINQYAYQDEMEEVQFIFYKDL